MKDDERPTTTETLVTAAEIARLAGVTRAAVSNWRRRHDDFPSPKTGSTSSPLFSLHEARAWLDKQRKGQEMSPEVRLWEQLRTLHGDNMIRGLTMVAEVLAGAHDQTAAPNLKALVDELTADHSPAELLGNLATRYAVSSGRAGVDGITSPQLVKAIRHFTDRQSETIFDPACGIGSLLLSFDDQAHTLIGQDIDATSTRYAQLRASLTGVRDVTISTGDSLRRDLHPETKADLVVCEPPAGVADWGREDLLLDPRWEFGVPSRAESELAWLQHCYHHTAPGGQVVMVMPASVAYRKAGRRIRAEIVRRGLLTQIVALPPGLAASHSLSVQLWILRRPDGRDTTVDFVRMTDLTGSAPEGPFEPEADQTADIPRIDLLGDTVDLTPATHISAKHTDFTAEYAAIQAAIGEQLALLLDLLPALTTGAPGSLHEGATVSLADLTRAGLIEVSDDSAVSTSDQLDTDYLNGFLRSASNTKRSTSTSGTFRTDTRGSRIPQMAISRQRRYGAAFRALAEFEQRVKKLTELSGQATNLARDGLTSGALTPPRSDRA
ncbi:N-6 DNA methylase [Streptomyces sp. NPDC006208]|uniref:N-6 DNA methylase n=1 Tax=Streptomyces sp. NPDC006208 TaxID=3156734 RepID=UPI0033A76236